ncbi:MAG: peptide ABC transporter substrate-binding protein [Patescibacteria group bacterium]
MLALAKRIKAILEAFSLAERRAFFSALAVAVIGFFFSANFLVGKITKIVPSEGGEFTEGMVGQPKFINPVLATTETDKSLVRLFFSNVSDLAEKIEASKDARAWNVRIKENVFWTDGERLTSDDIVFTVQKIQDPDSDSPLFLSWQGVLPRRVSEREVQFNLGVPYAFFDANLKNLYVLPRHIFANVPPPNWKISDFRLKPVGSGPYVFESYEAKSNGFIAGYRLKANKTHFSGAPLIPRFNIKFFAGKEEVIAAFNLGRIDGGANLEYTDLSGVKRPYETLRANLPSYYAVFMNQSQNLALKDPAVREALGRAADRNELIEKVFGGNAVPVTGPIPPRARGGTEAVPDATSSREAAREILEDAGWKAGADGIRRKIFPNGEIKLAFTLTVPQIPFLTDTADMVKNQWSFLGADVTVAVLPMDQIKEQNIKNREYQALLFGHILNQNFDLFSFWHSSERFYPGANLAIYNDKNTDRLIEAIRENPDPETRKVDFEKLREEITNDYPAVFLFSPDYLYVATKDLKGFVEGLIAEPADRFLNVSKWHLKTARVLK